VKKIAKESAISGKRQHFKWEKIYVKVLENPGTKPGERYKQEIDISRSVTMGIEPKERYKRESVISIKLNIEVRIESPIWTILFYIYNLLI